MAYFGHDCLVHLHTAKYSEVCRWISTIEHEEMAKAAGQGRSRSNDERVFLEKKKHMYKSFSKKPSKAILRTVRSTAFSLVELLVALCVILILAALTLGVSGRIFSKARQMKAINDLKQIYQGFQNYSVDNNGNIAIPRSGQPNNDYIVLIAPYMGYNVVDVSSHQKIKLQAPIFYSPLYTREIGYPYYLSARLESTYTAGVSRDAFKLNMPKVMSGTGWKVPTSIRVSVHDPRANWWLLRDSLPSYLGNSPKSWPDGSLLYLFFDGYVESLTPAQVNAYTGPDPSE